MRVLAVALAWLLALVVCPALGTQTNFDVATSADDGFLEQYGTTYPPTGHLSLNTANAALYAIQQKSGATYYQYEWLARWDTSPIDAPVWDAKLKFFISTSGIVNNDDRAMVCEWLTDGALATGDYVDSVGSTALSISLNSLTANAWNTVNLTGYDGSPGVSTSAYTKLRCGISGGAPVGNNRTNDKSLDGGYAPQLQVFWGATPTPTNTPTNTPTLTVGASPTITPTPSVTPTGGAYVDVI